MVRRRTQPPRRSVFEPSLPDYLEAQGFSAINAKRIWEHLVDNPHCDDLAEVPGLPAKLREVLANQFVASTSRVTRSIPAPDGTVKLLITLHDGAEIEAVVINQGGDGLFANAARSRMRAGATLCVSSQVGCRMGCSFCATGTLGLSGNLEASEILEQLRLAHQVRHDIRRLVFMGMGEPLENFQPVAEAACLMSTRSATFRLVERAVTVSTVGSPPGAISRLVQEGMAGTVRLAVSLHAPTQDLRQQIVPAAGSNPLSKLMAEVDAFSLAASKACRKARLDKVLIEYCVLGGINDSEEVAHRLGELLAPRKDHVMLNLIPYNPVPGKTFASPSDDDVNRIYWIVSSYGVRVHARRRLGGDVSAACGQLAKISLQGGEAPDVEELSLALGTAHKVGVGASMARAQPKSAPQSNMSDPSPVELPKAQLVAGIAVVVFVAAASMLSLSILRGQRLKLPAALS